MRRMLAVLIACAAGLVWSVSAFAVDEGEGGGSETIRCAYSYSYQAGNYDVHIYRWYYVYSGTWGGECRREYTMHQYTT